MTIEPDTKDWTWVLDERCPECGYDAALVPPESVAARVRAQPQLWREALARPDARDRPAPAVWSPLEYACHVRDVCTLFDSRLALMLGSDDAAFVNWNQDETAVADRYGEQDPAVVADQVAAAAERIAAGFDGIEGAAWERTGRRSDGAVFTVRTFSRYFLHDLLHHAWDVAGVRADA